MNEYLMMNMIKNKFLFMVLVLLVFLYSAHASNAGRKSQKPNIIFIMADDLGYAEIGPFGQELIQTPHLDQMAREGMKLTDIYANSINYYPTHLWRNSEWEGLPNSYFSPHQKLEDKDPYDPDSYSSFKGKAYSGDLMTQEAEKFIQDNSQKPFFLYLAYTIPHFGIRVPFIARWPGKIRSGSTSSHIAAIWDMMPTFGELAGIKEIPKPMACPFFQRFWDRIISRFRINTTIGKSTVS